jgi:hypothetical protein
VASDGFCFQTCHKLVRQDERAPSLAPSWKNRDGKWRDGKYSTCSILRARCVLAFLLLISHQLLKEPKLTGSLHASGLGFGEHMFCHPPLWLGACALESRKSIKRGQQFLTNRLVTTLNLAINVKSLELDPLNTTQYIP